MNLHPHHGVGLRGRLGPHRRLFVGSNRGLAREGRDRCGASLTSERRLGGSDVHRGGERRRERRRRLRTAGRARRRQRRLSCNTPPRRGSSVPWRMARLREAVPIMGIAISAPLTTAQLPGGSYWYRGHYEGADQFSGEFMKSSPRAATSTDGEHRQRDHRCRRHDVADHVRPSHPRQCSLPLTEVQSLETAAEEDNDGVDCQQEGDYEGNNEGVAGARGLRVTHLAAAAILAVTVGCGRVRPGRHGTRAAGRHRVHLGGRLRPRDARQRARCRQEGARAVRRLARLPRASRVGRGALVGIMASNEAIQQLTTLASGAPSKAQLARAANACSQPMPSFFTVCDSEWSRHRCSRSTTWAGR